MNPTFVLLYVSALCKNINNASFWWHFHRHHNSWGSACQQTSFWKSHAASQTKMVHFWESETVQIGWHARSMLKTPLLTSEPGLLIKREHEPKAPLPFRQKVPCCNYLPGSCNVLYIVHPFYSDTNRSELYQVPNTQDLQVCDWIGKCCWYRMCCIELLRILAILY